MFVKAKVQGPIFVAAMVIFMLAGCSASAAAPAASAVKDKPVINTFTADPANIDWGSATQVSWRVSNADRVVIDNAIGAVALSGAFTVYPTGNTAYKITATNAAGSCSATATIKVGNQAASSVAPAGSGTSIPVAPAPSSAFKPMVSDFHAAPLTILSGNKTTLSWIVQGADTVTIDHGIGNVSVSGFLNVKPAATTIYTLTASNKAGSATASAGVQVSDATRAVPVIRHFTSNPGTVVLGRTSTLSWEVTGADLVRISGIGNVTTSGTILMYPGSTVVYVLTATNSGGGSQATCQITVEE